MIIPKRSWNKPITRSFLANRINKSQNWWHQQAPQIFAFGSYCPNWATDLQNNRILMNQPSTVNCLLRESSTLSVNVTGAFMNIFFLVVLWMRMQSYGAFIRQRWIRHQYAKALPDLADGALVFSDRFSFAGPLPGGAKFKIIKWKTSTNLKHSLI